VIALWIDWCARNRFLVFTGTLGLVLAGIWAISRIPLDACQHRVETRLPGTESDAIHHLAGKIAGNAQRGIGRLVIYRSQQNGEKCGDRRRSSSIDFRVKVQRPIGPHVRIQIDLRLALGDREISPIEIAESLGKWLEPFGVLHQCLHLLFTGEPAEILERAGYGRRHRGRCLIGHTAI